MNKTKTISRPAWLRFPKIFDLRSDPYERADITSNSYYDWLMSDNAAPMLAAPAIVGNFLKTFKEYPPISVRTARLTRTDYELN